MSLKIQERIGATNRVVSEETERDGTQSKGGGTPFSILIDAKQKQLGAGLVLTGFSFLCKVEEAIC